MVLRSCAAICGAAILFVNSSSAMAKLGTVNAHSHSGGITAKGGYAYLIDRCGSPRCMHNEPK